MTTNIKILTRHLNVPECRWNELNIYQQLYIINQINELAEAKSKEEDNCDCGLTDKEVSDE